MPLSFPCSTRPWRLPVLVAAVVVLAGLGGVSSPAAAADFDCRIVDSGPDSLTVEWTEVPEADGYQYKLAVQGVGNHYRTVTGTTATITVAGDASKTLSMAPKVPGVYTPRVPCVFDGAAVADPVPTPTLPPAGDVEFTCTITPVQGGVAVAWSRVVGAVGYRYRWSIAGGGNRYRTIDRTNVTSIRLPADPGQEVAVQMAPVFPGRSIGRVPCGVALGGDDVELPADPGSTSGASASYPVRSNGDANQADIGPQCVNSNYNDNFPGLRFGDFLLKNNAWNADVAVGRWWQCISLIDRGDTVAPRWEYNWLNETDVSGPVWEVRSFPEVIYGTKSAFESSGSFAETGLPVIAGEMPTFTIDYAYTSEEHPTYSKDRAGDTIYGEKNVAIESFFHTSCDIEKGSNGDNRIYEVMVWLEGGPERKPDGAAGRRTEVTIGGERYEVWIKGAKDPGYVAFYALEPKRMGTLDWNAFIDWARANAHEWGAHRFHEDWCMGNIIFGTEIWWGKGVFTLDRFDITRS